MPPRILLINWRDVRNPEAGGAETYYHEIFRRLAQSGEYQVTVLSHSFPGCSSREAVDGTQVVRMGSRSLFNYQIMPYVSRNQKNFDLIIEDLNKLPFLTPLYVKTPRLHLAMHFFGRAIFKEIAAPMAAYVFLMEKMIPLVYRREHFVAISESTKSDLCTFGSRIDVVEPGIDTKFFYPAAPKSKEPTLLYVGRLKKYKNVQFVINCMPGIISRVPGAKLVIAGSGDFETFLKQRVEQLGLSGSVDFIGYVTEEKKRELLSQATVMVNPSIKEGWGITNIEANLCGTVSVSSNVHGLRDSVRNGDTGLLYEPENCIDYTEKVTRVLGDSEYRIGLEQNARPFAESFSWDRITHRMKTVLQRVC